MPRKNPPIPRSFRVHVFWVVVLCVILFALIGLTVFLTDGRDIGDFTRTDWQIFGAYIFASVVVLIAAFYIASRAGRVIAEHRHQVFLTHLHEGVDPADYASVLPDFEGDRRALIIRTESGYQLTLDQFDEQNDAWQPDGEPPMHFPDRMTLLQYLETECDFYVAPEDLDLFPPETE